MMAWMNLVKVERSFVFEMSTNWDIKNVNRVPRREKLVPLHVSSTDFTPQFSHYSSIFTRLDIFLTRSELLTGFYGTKAYKEEYIKLIINSVFHLWVNIYKA